MTLIPQKALVTKIEKAAPDIKIYTIQTQQKIEYSPCQFFLLGLLGFGEAPFVPTNYSKNKNNKDLVFAIRKVGLLTTAINNLKEGDNIWIRGPYGNGFPTGKLFDRDIIMVAGGTGIVPIVALTGFLLSDRKKYRAIYILYGTKTPSEIIFTDQIKVWKEQIPILLAAQEAPAAWPEHRGLVTDLCSKTKVIPKKTIVFICGPPPMFGPVITELKKCHNLPDEQIYVSLEARMKCGLGHCQHCTIDKHYVCLDGPIFSWNEVKHNFEE